MKRLSAILLCAAFLFIGTGGLQYVHNHAHELEDAQSHESAPPVHGDLNCAIHAMLKMSALPIAIVQLLICLGLFVAFLTMLPQHYVRQRLPLRLDCRGPPRA
jgi:hypothetical protein